jgi:putative membrane protein
MLLTNVIFWGLVLWGIVALVRHYSLRDGGATRQRESPEDLLARRFANGDIDADEYARRLQTLRGHRSTS